MGVATSSSDQEIQSLQDQVNGQTRQYGIQGGKLPGGVRPGSLATHRTSRALNFHVADARGKFGAPLAIPLTLQYYTGLTSSTGAPTTTELPLSGNFGWHLNTALVEYVFAYNDAGTIVYPGTTVYDDSATVRRNSGAINAFNYLVNGTQVVSTQLAAVADATTGGGATAANCATTINLILTRMRDHGLIAL